MTNNELMLNKFFRLLGDENKFKIMDDKTLTQKNALDLYRRTFDHFYDVTREAMLDPDQGGEAVRRLLGIERKVSISKNPLTRGEESDKIGREEPKRRIYDPARVI